MKDRRQMSVRGATDISVVIETRTTLFRGRVCDISCDGMQVLSNEHLRLATEYVFVLDLDGGLVARGVVRWCVALSSNSYRAGIAFRDTSTELLFAVHKLLDTAA